MRWGFIVVLLFSVFQGTSTGGRASGRESPRRSPGRTETFPEVVVARQLGLCELGTLKVAWQTPIWAWLQAALALPRSPLHCCCFKVEMHWPTDEKAGLTLVLIVTVPQSNETGPVVAFVRRARKPEAPQTGPTPPGGPSRLPPVVVP